MAEAKQIQIKKESKTTSESKSSLEHFIQVAMVSSSVSILKST